VDALAIVEKGGIGVQVDADEAGSQAASGRHLRSVDGIAAVGSRFTCDIQGEPGRFVEGRLTAAAIGTEAAQCRRAGGDDGDGARCGGTAVTVERHDAIAIRGCATSPAADRHGGGFRRGERRHGPGVWHEDARAILEVYRTG